MISITLSRGKLKLIRGEAGAGDLPSSATADDKTKERKIPIAKLLAKG